MPRTQKHSWNPLGPAPLAFAGLSFVAMAIADDVAIHARGTEEELGCVSLFVLPAHTTALAAEA
jgi:hypothetical protein